MKKVCSSFEGWGIERTFVFAILVRPLYYDGVVVVACNSLIVKTFDVPIILEGI